MSKKKSSISIVVTEGAPDVEVSHNPEPEAIKPAAPEVVNTPVPKGVGGRFIDVGGGVLKRVPASNA